MDRYDIALGKRPLKIKVLPKKKKRPLKVPSSNMHDDDRGAERRPIIETIRETVVDRYLQTPEDRRILAASMAQPMQARMDNVGSMARRAFFVDPLPDGAVPLIRSDNNVPLPGSLLCCCGKRTTNHTDSRSIADPYFRHCFKSFHSSCLCTNTKRTPICFGQSGHGFGLSGNPPP